MDNDDIQDRLLDSTRILEFECAKLGGWKQFYGGYLDEDDASGPGFVGPLIWSEADLVHRFADHLTAAFRDVESYGRPAVHLGLPIRVGTRSDLVRDADGRWPPVEHIDIVITDPTALDGFGDEPQAAGAAFRQQKHLAFIEVKWFHKGSQRWVNQNWRKKVKEGVQPDLDSLARHQAAGRCQVAAMLLVDDTSAYIKRYDELSWPDQVLRLAVDPRSVSDAHLDDESP